MANSNLDAIYSQIDSLPALPATAANVLQVTSDPESSAHDLMQAILPDQSMCAAILKIANSAFFGLPREVGTVEKAVMVLGFDEVKNIVLGKAVFNSFKDLNGGNRASLDNLWHHAFTCGLAAKILAERSHISPSEMFIAGLIHDIGKLAMLMSFPNIYSHLLKSQTAQSQNLYKERELFFIGHDEVARLILDRWLFPLRLIESVGYHHRPKEAEEAVLPAACIQIADVMAHIFHHPDGSSAADFTSRFAEIAPEALRLWQNEGMNCSRDEVALWFELLAQSHAKDTAILAIFSS